MKVLFDIIAGQITIEGDGAELVSVLEKAREMAPKLSEIRLITSPKQTPHVTPNQKGDAAQIPSHQDQSPASQAPPTLREFVKLVGPGSIAEGIVTVGVYQARYHGQESFTPKQMAEWFSHAGLTKPTQMPVVLYTTKQRYGYVENPSHGRWKVSVAGENFITGKLEARGGSNK